MTECRDVSLIGSWQVVRDLARTTVRKGPLGEGKEVSAKFRRAMLLAEHSPIRALNFRYTLHNLKSWVSVHLVRHWLGVVHFVSTQRTDRTGVDRNQMPQDTPVIHEMVANPQALIYMSRKRLCFLASPETTEAWRKVKTGIASVDPDVAAVMVPECVYRGFCPETGKCKPRYDETPKFQRDLEAYRANAGWRKS